MAPPYFWSVPFPSPRCPAPMTGCALRARKLRFGGESGNAAPHRTKEEGCRPTAPTGRSGTVVAGLAATSPPRGVLLREWRVGVYGRRAMTLPALTCGMLSGEHRDLKGPPNNNGGRRPPPLLWARRSSDGTTRSRYFRQVPFPSPRCPAPMTGCALRARKLRFGGESGNAAPHRTKEEGCRPTAPTGRSGTVVAGLAATSPSNAQQRSGTKALSLSIVGRSHAAAAGARMRWAASSGTTCTRDMAAARPRTHSRAE